MAHPQFLGDFPVFVIRPGNINFVSNHSPMIASLDQVAVHAIVTLGNQGICISNLQIIFA